MTDVNPMAYSISDAAAASSLSRTRLYQLINEGRLEVVKIGRRTLVKARSLERLLETGT